MRVATSCFRSALCDSVFELGTGVWESMSVLCIVGVGSMRSGIVWEEPQRGPAKVSSAASWRHFYRVESAPSE